jgi:site-specific DNA-methyltransferase (adenine-specific)
MIEMLNIDCVEYMRTCEDNKFDLAIVDPPYGIGQNWKKDRGAQHYKHRNSFNDSPPGDDYFKELFRVSKNQIIWGCNYYWQHLTPTNNLIFWDKARDGLTQNGSSGELAWVSFGKYPLFTIRLPWNGAIVCEKVTKIHPHQKPVELYRKTLDLFATDGDLILDTHSGSFSSAVACVEKGFSGVFCELDPDYYGQGRGRVNKTSRQYELMKPDKRPTHEQGTLEGGFRGNPMKPEGKL